MSYFDYGYFKYSNKNIKKFDPKKVYKGQPNPTKL